MGVERAALDDAQRFRRDGLDAEIVGAGRDGALDLRAQQILERAEQHVLQVDGEREQPVEEGRDRRQFFAQRAVGIGQVKPGRGLEFPERTAFDLAGIEQRVELAQRRAAIDRIRDCPRGGTAPGRRSGAGPW